MHRRWKCTNCERFTITTRSLRKIDQLDIAEISPTLFPPATMIVVRDRKIPADRAKDQSLGEFFTSLKYGMLQIKVTSPL